VGKWNDVQFEGLAGGGSLSARLPVGMGENIPETLLERVQGL
jgi:hypothetical protein